MKSLFAFLLTLIGLVVFSQDYKPYNRFSLEADYGISIPMMIVSDVSSDNFISPTHFAAGVRYMFNQQWGVKGQFVVDQFKEGPELGTNFFRLDAQVHYNLGRQINLVFDTYERFGLFLHSGFGASRAKSLYNNSIEHNGNFIFGITPMLRLSQKVALTGDVSYVLNIKQHFYFDGVPFDPATVKFEHGAQATFSFGLVFYLGDKRYHADWY